MRIIDEKSFSSLCISNIVVMSGVRPAGRTIDMGKGRHSHGFFYLLHGGAVFFPEAGKNLAVKEGELLYIPKCCRYKMQYTEADTAYVLLNLEMFDRTGEDLALFEGITLLCREDVAHRIASVMSKLEQSASDQNPAAELHRKELAYRLLSTVYHKNIELLPGNNRYPQILPGVLLLRQSYLENIPVTKFAQVCNISVSSFRDLFRKQFGMSPVQYRNLLRIERAKELLREGSCTVAEAAYASGFENIGYFCRYYKQVTGERPSQGKNLATEDRLA